MVNYAVLYGAALVALLIALAALVDVDFLRYAFGDRIKRRFTWREFFASEVGAVSVTYYARGGSGVRINGSTTAPTQIQASFLMKQSAVIVFGVTADAQALFTHNWGLDASAPTYFDPEVLYVEPISVTTYQPLFTFDRSNTNVLAINKPATDGPTTIRVTLRRPHSIGD